MDRSVWNWAEFQIPVWRMSLRGWKLWEALERALERDRVLEAYDVVQCHWEVEGN